MQLSQTLKRSLGVLPSTHQAYSFRSIASTERERFARFVLKTCDDRVPAYNDHILHGTMREPLYVYRLFEKASTLPRSSEVKRSVLIFPGID